ncbi:MAG: FAD-binding oxidoreductase [Anaerolineales bacterium]|nr:FAD-binding oxidoreductase [Anaerolineales bacterium]
MSTTFDVIIAGGGVMGCATAYYLLHQDPSLTVAIVEKDPSYKHASTILSDGNVRIQFNLKENIQISQYALEVLPEFGERMAVGDKKPAVAARHQGNLFLVDEANRAAAEAGLALQQSLGCEVDWLTAVEIAAAYPAYAGEGFIGGTLGRRDGSVDPQAVLTGYRDKAVALGATYITAVVTDFLTDPTGTHMRGVRLADGRELSSPLVINTAGAWARDLLQTIGVDLPVLPIMRQVFVVQTNIPTSGFLPSIFLPTGLYVIHENEGHFLVGKSFPDDPEGYDFTMRPRIFEERMWPELVDYLPAFERLKVVGGWAGLYAVNTLDGNAILGEWPEVAGLYLANGFSGHGFQQCHAVGRYLAELILEKTPVLDLSIFAPERVLSHTAVVEHAGRII